MKFLIVGPAWVGDMVMAQSLFKHLKTRYGTDTIIDVVAPAWSLPVLHRMPEVRRGIALDVKHGEFGWSARKTLGMGLRSEGYDRAIVMPITWKSALVPFFAGIPVRTGFIGELRFGLLNDRRKLDKKAMPMMVQRYLALDEPGAGIQNPVLRVDAANQRRLIAALGLDAARSAIAFFPGAEYGPAKRWPPEHFAALANMLGDRGYQIWVMGSAKERELGEVIAADNGAVVNLCGQTQLADAIDLIAFCKAAVTNDSGLMHIAAAVGVPVTVIYGSSTPEHTPPLTDKKQAVSLNLACSPCFKRVCPLGHTKCLTKITPQRVFECLSPM